MNVLLLAPRFPWPPYQGDRLRSTIWLAALARHANVALVSPPGEVPADAPPFRFHPAAHSAAAAARAALRVSRGASLQSLIAAPYDWTSAIESASRDLGSVDATIVILTRLDPWVRVALPQSFLILDAVDSLGRSMSERTSEAAPLHRWFWRGETKRVEREESDAIGAYDRVIVVSDEDADHLGAMVVSNGVEIAPLGVAPRSYDFAFWGRLPYFANTDAAMWLLDEIWPRIRARRPDATLLIAGADAPSKVRGMNGSHGITVVSPVANIATLARDIRVAIFPVRYGTGQSNKVLEAAEGGCGIVATTKAIRGLDPLVPFIDVANDADALAEAAVAALEKSPSALRHAVELHYSREKTLERLAAIVQAAEAAA